MTYEIGQKVETPLGVGEVKGVRDYQSPIYQIKFMDSNFKVLDFEENELQPYKTPHDKLIELGFRQSQNTLVNNTLYTIYEIDGGSITIIDGKENYYKTKMKVNLELSRILTEYLEWLEEEE